MRRLSAVYIIILCSLQIAAQKNYPFFSIEINKKVIYATEREGVFENKLRFSLQSKNSGQLFEEVLLENISNDTLEIRNVVPFGATADHVYITGLGEHELSRTHLFIPGKMPVNVICPDNAWELGFSCQENVDGKNMASLIRLWHIARLKVRRKRRNDSSTH